jgi:hypothetical protein
MAGRPGTEVRGGEGSPVELVVDWYDVIWSALPDEWSAGG